MGIYWRLLRIYVNKYLLKKATYHIVNQSYNRITNECQAHVLLLLSKSPGHRIKGQDAHSGSALAQW